MTWPTAIHGSTAPKPDSATEFVRLPLVAPGKCPVFDETIVGASLGQVSAPGARKRLTGVFGKRYGEIFLVYPGQPDPQATVYSSFGLNDCPNELWSALDPEAIAAEHGAAAAILDGPRRWLVSQIEQESPDPLVTTTFGGIEMRRQATVALPPDFLSMMSPEPYVAKQVNRKVVLTFEPGNQIYELVDPHGRRWVMQSWSQNIDIALSLDDLRTLANRLTLPPGWTYRPQTLNTPLRLDITTRDTPVILDTLGNLYSRVND